jgi:hypothetical protein
MREDPPARTDREASGRICMSRMGLVLAALAAALVLPSPVWAQSSGSYGGRNLPNHETTRTFEGKVMEIDVGGQRLAVGIEGKPFLVELHEKTKLKADKKTGLHEKDLSLEDFLVGSRVKIKVRTSDGRVLEMRLRELGAS